MARNLYMQAAVAAVLLSGVAASCQPPPTIQLPLQNCTISEPNQPDVVSWGARIGVSNSSEVCIVPSTVINSTFLQSSEICNNDQLDGMTYAQCRSRRGGSVTRSSLPSAPTEGLGDINPGWVSLMQSNGTQPFQYAADAGLQLRVDSVT